MADSAPSALWTTPTRLRQQLQKRWDRGIFLAAALSEERLFPLRLPLKGPGSRQLGEHFSEVRHWIDQLLQQEKRADEAGYRIEWQRINHRQLGENRIPLAVILESEHDLLTLLRKRQQWEQFLTSSQQLLSTFPQLKGWAIRFPHKLLRYHPQWSRLIDVLEWMVNHPHPNRYLRQIDLPQIDTKFIEQHKKILMELLDQILPAAQIERQFTGIKGFEQRYGLLSKPLLIRFRLLDPALQIAGLSDLTLPVTDFAQLELAATTVFITENEINGLSFPQHPNSLVIFGLGYGLQPLQQVEWLTQRHIYYWGDIDTHGFAMLDQVRHYLPQTRSLLMDRDTLLNHQPFWGKEHSPTQRTLALLQPEEQALYQTLLEQTLAPNLRLEQERIRYPLLCNTLAYLKEEGEPA